MNAGEWVVYLVRCADGSLYCGITKDIERRLDAHNAGKGSKYTRYRLPVALAGISPRMSKGDALKLERRIKQVSAAEKICELATWAPQG